jgi:hypothetical protein
MRIVMGNAAIDALRHCFVCASIACSAQCVAVFPVERFAAAPDQYQQHNN